MPEILTIGTSGLVTLQRALATTSNNIVNANTEGYTRQIVHFESLPTQRLGDNFFGNGVNIGTIKRSYDAFLVDQARDLTSSYASHNTSSQMLSRLDNLLANADSGVSQSIQSFFNSLQDLSSNPAGTPERQVVLGEAASLVSQVNAVDASMRSMVEDVNGRLSILVGEVNDLASRLGFINTKLIEQSGANASPNDLLDQRDMILTQLAERVGIDTIEEPDGSISVLIGSGQALVVGTRSFDLGVVRNDFDGGQMEVTYEPSDGVVTQVSGQLRGGELSGLIEFRDRSLNAARDNLGVVVAGLTETFNAGHRLGIDLNGVPGGDFFAPASVSVLEPASNQGTAALSISIDDVSGLQATDYLMQFDGTQWNVIRRSDEMVSTGSGPFSLDGMTISVAGVPQAGDRFVIQPTRNSAEEFAMLVQRTTDIAAASPLVQSIDATNIGDVKIDDLSVSSQSGLPLAADIVLTFDPDALGVGMPGFTVTGSAVTTLAYDPATDKNGVQLSLPDAGGLTFNVSGIPQPGDQLRATNNIGGTGDARNILSLIDLQNSKVLESGNSTYTDAYGNLIARIGVQTRHAQANMQTDESLLAQAVAARESVSGVNLEEEAANLLRYQQAYQAAAQMIAVADSMFDALLGAARR